MIKVLAYVNHFFGARTAFKGGSTTTPEETRRRMVQNVINSLLELKSVDIDVKVCGIAGNSLIPIDLDFSHLNDPRHLCYSSIQEQCSHVDDWDYFINIEDDIILPNETWQKVIEFDAECLLSECFLPNRLEVREGKRVCVDLEATPGWTSQSKVFQQQLLGVALNPHSGLSILSQAKLRYAIDRVNLSRREIVVGGYMASAYANLHSVFSLYRPMTDIEFAPVIHLDHWQSLNQGPAMEIHESNSKTQLKEQRSGVELFTAVLLSFKRHHNLPRIIESLQETGRVGEILVWNNNPKINLSIEGATVVNAQENFGCFARYCLAILARHENIWFQDDDLVLSPLQFDVIAGNFLADKSGVYGCRGRLIGKNGQYIFGDVYGKVDVILGQTMMFHKSTLVKGLSYLGRLPSPGNSDDIAFSLVSLAPLTAVNVEPIEDLGMSDENALYRRPEHPGERQLALATYGAWAKENCVRASGSLLDCFPRL